MRRAAPLFAALTALALSACDGPGPEVPPQPHPITTVSATSSATAPAADPAPVTDGDTTVAWVNGVQVIVKRIPGAEISAMQLCIKGGARDWTAKDAGIAQLALGVATSGGTTTFDKDAYYRKLAALGSEIRGDSMPDYSVIKAKTLLSQWDETFALLADTFLHPAMPPSELEVRRSQQISGIRHEQEDPDMSLAMAVNAGIFKGHPFENRPIGTEASVSALTLDAVKAYLEKMRDPGRLLFVAVGDVDPAHVVEKVKGAFGALPKGSYQETALPGISFDKASLQVVERKLATNYIEGVFTAPSWTSPDFADAMVAMSLLGYRVFEEVRTKRNLSYAPSARFVTSSSIGRGLLYVTAVDPGATIKVMFDEVKKLQNETASDKEITSTKSTFLTHYLMDNEATAGQAGMLATAQLLAGDWKLARTLPDRIRAVTPAGVQAFAKKYLSHMQFTVLGDPEKVDKTLFTSL